MSICAHFFVLFRNSPTQERLDELEFTLINRAGRGMEPNLFDDELYHFIPVDDADK